ncbi:hypothetical protein JCM1840_001781 [Sporobolomyces johnsonii]
MAPNSTTSDKAPASNQPHGAKGGKAPKKAVKGTKGIKVHQGSDKKKKKRKSKETYSSYIYKVLKQVHPDSGISNKAMLVLNSFVNDIFDRLADEAVKLVAYNHKRTLSSREMQTSARLLLPGELSKHAISEGTKAIAKFSSNT